MSAGVFEWLGMWWCRDGSPVGPRGSYDIPRTLRPYLCSENTASRTDSNDSTESVRQIRQRITTGSVSFDWEGWSSKLDGKWACSSSVALTLLQPSYSFETFSARILGNDLASPAP